MSDVPEGWYPDHTDHRLVRYWTGAEWSEHTAPKDARSAKLIETEKAQAARVAQQSQVRERADQERRARAEKREAIRASEKRARSQHLQQAADFAADAAKEESAYWGEVRVVGNTLSKKAREVIRAHTTADDKPWFVLVPYGFAGVLVAWDDRLMIIKTGAMTSFMAGTLGGGRITTFPFTEITGIEFNGQFLSGVLEVLTASYQGTANKDYWRGTSASRNADANDPFTLSNTLPIAKETYNAAQPELNELRRKILSAKSPGVAVAAPIVTSGIGSVADELTKLAELNKSGVLTDDEFATAKAKLLGG